MEKAEIKERCKDIMLACENFIIFKRRYLKSKDVAKFEEVFNEVREEAEKPKKRGRQKASEAKEEAEQEATNG